MSERRNRRDMKIDCLAKKLFVRLRDEVAPRINERVGESTSQEELTRRFSEAIGERLILREGAELPRMTVDTFYPLEVFIPKASPEAAKQYSDRGLFGSLPQVIQISDVWHAFSDSSMLLVSIPSSSVLAAGRFLSQMKEYPEAREALGFSGDDLGAAEELIGVAAFKKHILPLSAGEFESFLERKLTMMSRLPMESNFRINFSERLVGYGEVFSALSRFSNTQEDTFSNSLAAVLNSYSKRAA